MAFGLKAPIPGDIVEIAKYDARAGRMLRIDYNPETREKLPIDITSPPPRFAIDFPTMELGYAHYPTGAPPEYITVPAEQPPPKQPPDRDAEGKPKYRAVVRLKIYGRILDGIREFSPTANIVQEALEDLYLKYRDASEAQAGKIPVVELTRTIPVQMGKPPRQSTNYMPCFAIVGWTERLPEMGERTVPPPLGAQRTSAPPAPAVREFEPQGVTSDKPLPKSGGALLDDEIPFGACWQ